MGQLTTSYADHKNTSFTCSNKKNIFANPYKGSLANYQSYPKIKIQNFFFDIETVISFFTVGC